MEFFQTIPLLNFSSLIASVFCVLTVIKLYFAHRKDREDENIKNFCLAFIFYSWALSISSLVGFLDDLFIFQGAISFTFFLLYLGLNYFLLVSFSIANRTRNEKLLSFSLILSWGILIAVLRMLFFVPSTIYMIEGTFPFIQEGTPFWLLVLNDLGIVLLFLVMSYYFFQGARRSKEGRTRLRAYLLGFGMFGSILPLLIYHFVLPLYPFFWLLIIEAILVLLVGALIYAGVFYQSS